MNEFNKELLNTKFNNDNEIATKLEFDSDFNFYKNLKDEQKPIFISNKASSKNTMDQIMMLGHYLYTQNDDFRESYKKVNNGKDFAFDNPLKLQFLIKDYFNILLYGKVASTYIKNMPDIPIHYFERLRAEEINNSLRMYLNDQKAMGVKGVINKVGGPFYCYQLKKSKVMSNGESKIVICPIKNIVKDMKEQANFLSDFADCVINLLLNSRDKTKIDFVNNFLDQSWSPYLIGDTKDD